MIIVRLLSIVDFSSFIDYLPKQIETFRMKENRNLWKIQWSPHTNKHSNINSTHVPKFKNFDDELFLKKT